MRGSTASRIAYEQSNHQATRRVNELHGTAPPHGRIQRSHLRICKARPSDSYPRRSCRPPSARVGVLTRVAVIDLIAAVASPRATSLSLLVVARLRRHFRRNRANRLVLVKTPPVVESPSQDMKEVDCARQHG